MILYLTYLFSSPEPKADKVSLYYSKALSSVVHTFEQLYLQDQLANFSQILSVAPLGWGKGCFRFGPKLWLLWQQKLPLTYNGQNGVPAFSQSPWKSSNLGQVGLFTTELFALERSHWLWMGENGVSIFSQLLWNQSSSNLQVTRTGIKSQTSSNFGRIWPDTLELCALWAVKKMMSPAFLSHLWLDLCQTCG